MGIFGVGKCLASSFQAWKKLLMQISLRLIIVSYLMSPKLMISDLFSGFTSRTWSTLSQQWSFVPFTYLNMKADFIAMVNFLMLKKPSPPLGC